MARTLCSPRTAADSRSKRDRQIVPVTGNGAERATHIRTTDRPDTDAGILPGGNVSFCPDGRHVAYVKTERTPEVAQAEAALATAAGAERAARLQALTRAVARASQLRLSDRDGRKR